MGLAAASLITQQAAATIHVQIGGQLWGFFVFLLLLWVFSKLTHSAVIVKKKGCFLMIKSINIQGLSW